MSEEKTLEPTSKEAKTVELSEKDLDEVAGGVDWLSILQKTTPIVSSGPDGIGSVGIGLGKKEIPEGRIVESTAERQSKRSHRWRAPLPWSQIVLVARLQSEFRY